MGLIFFLSHQSANQSSQLSGGMIEAVLKFILPGLSADKLNVLISSLQFIVRKGAHFTLYTILGFLGFFTLVTYERLALIIRCLCAFLIGAVYSVTDEFHQTFIPGRSGELRDICIDSGGVLTGVLISLLIYKFVLLLSKKRKATRMKKKQYIQLTETLQCELNKTKLDLEDLWAENEELTQENTALISEIEKLKEELVSNTVTSSKPTEGVESLFVEEVTDEPEKAEETTEAETVMPEVNIPDDMAYGAEVIGKIVLSAAKHCNSLTTFPTNENLKELVNLILGRTEVAKSEILKIVALDIDRENKIVAMEKEASEAEDYFKSVMAQK